MGILTGELHKLVFGGVLAGTETWSCSIHMGTDGAETENDHQAMLDMRLPIEDWFKRPGTAINPSARLNFIKLNKVNKADGKYADGTDSQTLFFEPMVSPTGSSVSSPPQMTQALSWKTDIMRGRASKGRIYPPTSCLPNGTGSAGPDGLMTLESTQVMADSAQELLAELNNATTNLTCVVWSQVGQVMRAIEFVNCGRVVDTQQRRRRNLPELRVSALAPV